MYLAALLYSTMMIKTVEDSLKPPLGRINHSRQNSGWGIPCARLLYLAGFGIACNPVILPPVSVIGSVDLEFWTAGSQSRVLLNGDL
ncbi:unnamed protein product [Clonostachys rosea f. rosea IK726]|uniref:Uncharacterized protein n=1 Tax=Clonostachys rosea f. rosea IK726 TaxID=1349383 RepID=A0ACA9UKP0_BIOOC|nr:unnamed protein product [Clonostachys rosea f. rosea IK726]